MSKSFVILNKIAIHLNAPKFSHNGFGYLLTLKTLILIGKKSFGISLFGFGFTITLDKSEDKLWMWEMWKEGK